MATLASLLARDAIVSLDMIEQALQRQVLEGGELDTALLELAQVPENVLAAYRAASFDLPPAARAELAAVDPALRSRLPAEVAREHRVVPLHAEGDTLVLASAWPLASADAQRLQRRLRGKFRLRIATELRLNEALSRHYAIELGSRMRLLVERLEPRDPGALCEVQPLGPLSGPPAAQVSSIGSGTAPALRGGASIDGGTAPALRGGAAIPPAPSANDAEPPGRSSFPPERGVGTSVVPPAVVRVVPMVRLGSQRPAALPLHESPAPQHDTRPVRIPATAATGSSRPPRRISGAPRGPLARAQAIELLGQARDRDRVLDVFFSFARQYFECTVLFALRDERLLGMDASGLPSLADLLAVEVPIASTGPLQGVVSTRTARVVRLDPSTPAGALAVAIGRGGAQPCALIPVVIRQRVVSLLYGDRSGEPIVLAELSDLLDSLPAVSAAFERIIQDRKVEAMNARRSQGLKSPAAGAEPAAPAGTFRPTSSALRMTASGLAPQNVSAAAGLAPPKVSTAAGLSAGGPAADGTHAAAAPTDGGNAPALRGGAPVGAHGDDVTERPTMVLPTEGITAGMRRGSERPPAPGASTDSPVFEPRKRKEQDITHPQRPSRLPRARAHSSSAQRPIDPPSPRTLSQPPAGTGSYAVRDSHSEAVEARTQRGTRAPERASHGPARSGAPGRVGRADPRRDDGAAVQAEVVSISAAVRESLRPPRPEQDAPVDSIVLDAGGDAERLVAELCRCGPDEEGPQVAALRRIGDGALAVLERRFPGPLWFDRHKPRTRLPAGRDISAIARALFEFEERALPHIAALLASPQTDVRLCAAMLAADRVGPELLWPMYQRLFDADGQVRLTAIESLPLFHNVTGFDEVLKSLRQKAAAEAEAIPNRLAALEAISVLRDPGSIELLADLSAHGSRQLSVPAHRTLIAITAQDFANVPRKWKAWIDKNKGRHRVEWLIEGLMHSEERVRATAGMELQKLTQVYYGFSASAAKRDRERAQKRYRDWWDSQGRTQFNG
jgi:hypothetical protein